MSTLDSAASASPCDCPDDAILAQLSRVTGSRTFTSAPVLRHLITHLVTGTVSGHADQLKEYSVGIDVFGRGGSFDPRVDTIVRVHARRLRTRLHEYYTTEGVDDPVVIDLPKGHYVPTFRRADHGPGTPRGEVAVDSVMRAPARWSSRWWLGLAAGVVIGATLVVLLRGSAGLGSAESVSASSVASGAETIDSPSTLTILVTPFENHTGDASLDAIGQRAADQVVAAIATLEPGAAASLSTRSSVAAPPAPDLIVSGTYYSDGSALEFQTRLTDRRSGRLLHGVTTDGGSKTDPVAALESVQQSVAGAIAVHQDDFLGGLDVVSHPPTLEAYREYRAGLEIFQSDYTRALAHLQRAHELAPRFLPPMVVMVFAYGNLGQPDAAERVVVEMEQAADRLTASERLIVEFMRSNRSGRREQARYLLQELEKRMPPSLFVNHNLIDAYIAANRPQAAVATYLRWPSSAKSLRHSVGSYRQLRFLQALHMLGDYDRELEVSRRAQADVPGALVSMEAEIRALIGLGRVSDIHAIVERSQALPRSAGWGETPGDLMARTAEELRAHSYRDESVAMAAKAVDWHRNRSSQSGSDRLSRESLARALYLAERWSEAAPIFLRLSTDFPDDPEYDAWVARTAARAGDAQRARDLAAELAQLTVPIHRGWMTYSRASIAAALGERDRALELLRDAFTEGFPHGPHLHQNADFDGLRDYEPYQRLIRPSG